jgi:hypothetical protein
VLKKITSKMIYSCVFEICFGVKNKYKKEPIKENNMG